MVGGLCNAVVWAWLFWFAGCWLGGCDVLVVVWYVG